jgi:hypothetical protein
MSDYPFHLFLSHSSKDKGEVRELALRLRRSGLRVWFDEWEIKPGDSIPAKVIEGLIQSRVLVLCMSANAYGSDWALLESYTVRFKDPLNRGRRFVPVRLDDAPVIDSLAHFDYVDWRNGMREQELPRLLEACGLQVPIQNEAAEQIPEAVDTSPMSDEGESFVHSSAADYFHDRFVSAFPGLRDEVRYVDEPAKIMQRLQRLFRKPLKFSGMAPMWWFRGSRNNSVDSFRQLDERTVLIDEDEFEVARIAGVAGNAYWKSFVYLEARAVAPSGVRNVPDEFIQKGIRQRGFYDEEVCLFRGQYLSRQYYDDGTAEIDGDIVDISSEAELRVRYLSPYNIVVAGNDSSIGDTSFDDELDHFLNGILQGTETLESLAERANSLPKQVRYCH